VITWCNAVVAGVSCSCPEPKMSIPRVTIYTDGAARGNPGPAAIGVTIKDETGRLIAHISRHIGITTNNQAEYLAVIAALEKAVTLGAGKVILNSDSELIVRQVNGQYRVKNAALKPLHQKVKQLISLLEDFTIKHIPRQQNTEADKLANKALDGI
jgi:ribonuclease HI